MAKRDLDWWYERVVKRLPASLAGLCDSARPSFAASWGGPFNGQAGRTRAFEAIVRAHPFEAIVETGTYRGSTAGWLRETTGLPVFTIEANGRFYHYSKRRFRHDPKVNVFHGDSRAFLADCKETRRVPPQRVFFYLDAHWGEDLPLADELGTIAAGWKDSVVMIDDFEVPDDPGYAFDDYGPSRRLSLEYIPPAVLAEFVVFWPALRSQEETGARRGCVVLATRDAAAEALDQVAELRRGGAAERVVARRTEPRAPSVAR